VDATEELQEQIKRASLPVLAARIREARLEFGSHDKLAAEIGTNRQHLIKLEQAKHRPRPAMLLLIAEATGRSVDWFLDSEVDPSPFPRRRNGRRAA